MLVKNDYSCCLTNLACSIRKYFDLPCAHQSLSEIDDILEKNQPENVVVLLLDGMGSNILDRQLPESAFLRKNKLKNLTSVFPATTTACTTSVMTGLNPVEHGWLGWDMFVESVGKTITLFLGTEKVSKEHCREYTDKPNALIKKYIPQEIEEAGKYESEFFASFLKQKYYDFDVIVRDIKAKCKKPPKNGKRYIYAYDSNPDGMMHQFGPDSKNVNEILLDRSTKLEKLCTELKNTVVIVVADHGHIELEHVMLSDFPDFLALLERTPALEQRACSFKVLKGREEEFKSLFEKYFGNDFKLYSADEIIKSQLFGSVGTENSPGENPLFRAGIGDFIAIAENSKKAFVSEGSKVQKSNHAGYTDDEIYVPLIVKICE